jgi:hypothetical protein
MKTFVLVTCLAALSIAPVAHAQTWNETGDAGDLVASAQSTVGSGALQTINGNLASATDVDLYCVHLTAVPPANLPIVQIVCASPTSPNVRLFDALGNGVLTNETCSGSVKTILAPNVSLAAGTYYIGVAYSGLNPQSAGGAIWLSPVPGQRVPDGPGAAGTLTGWSGSPNVQPINPYTINLDFMAYCEAPTPALPATWGALKVHYAQ